MPETLADIILTKKLIKPAELKKLQEEAAESELTLEDLIFQKKVILPRELTQAKAEFYKIPYHELAGETISADILKEIPEETATYYKFIPFAREDGVLKVGMVNPRDPQALEALRFIGVWRHLDTKIYIISKKDLDEILRLYRPLAAEAREALSELEKELKVKKTPLRKKLKSEKIERVISEAPISKVVAVILKHAVEGRASDIHIEPTDKDLRVRFRVDGVLHTSLILPKQIHSGIVTRIKILSNLKIDETRKPQDGRFGTKVEGKEIDLRVSTLPTANGEKVALRILEKSIGLKSLKGLGFWGKGLKILEQNIKKPYGMTLITGPTGCGKSTTLYAITQILNKEGVNIITLEDPVEYFINGISQSQIRPEIGYTFSSGLRSIVRQDPDIILVGEIRDEETAELAIHAALTGHIVLSTLHTNNAVGVVPRLIDMGTASFLLSASLNVTIAQRLVRKLCEHCRKEVPVLKEKKDLIIKELSGVPEKLMPGIDLTKPKLYQAKGCKYCYWKGKIGRIAIFEILSMTDELERIIGTRPNEAEILKEAKRQGMITMKQDGIIKALKGIVSLEEVLQVVEA